MKTSVRVRLLTLGVVMIGVSGTGDVWGATPPDTTLATRQEAALVKASAGLVPNRVYDQGGRDDCVTIQSDGFGLVAQLELDRRGLGGGVDPATAAPWAKHIAETITDLVGTGGTQGRCHWTNAGAPGIMNATVGVAYSLHRYGSAWPADVKEAIRAAAMDASWDVSYYLHNANIPIVAAEVLVGEALANAELSARGLDHLEQVTDRVLHHGGLEENAPLYTAHHFPSLLFMQGLNDSRARALGRILLDYTLLMQAHLYLPGGGLGAPQSRDYSGGAADGGDRAMIPVLWLLVGDPALDVDIDNSYNFLVSAATDYVVPEIIRSIFLDKGDGYTFWTYTDAQQGGSRTPDSVYDLGLDSERAIPWQAVVLPFGTASIGVAYGYRLSALYVSSGTYVRNPSGGFAILYQFQPAVPGDTDHTGSALGGSGFNDDPDDFTCELYDYERMVHGRTAISLWDPTTATKPAGVVRTHQDTRVHLPNFDALGGESMRASEWYVQRLAESYLAYLPLGAVAAEESRDQGSWTYLRLDGPSGGVVEIASADEFATLQEYADDLAARTVVFETQPLAAEVDARDLSTGGIARIRLEHSPERRVVDGIELSVEEALDHGLMESPWVGWDRTSRVLRVTRDCYGPLVYDWDDATFTEEAPPPNCTPGEDGGVDGGSGGSSGNGGSGGDASIGPVGEAVSPSGPTSDEGGCGCDVRRQANASPFSSLLLWLNAEPNP